MTSTNSNQLYDVVLIDGDVLAYMIGFSLETHHYGVQFENKDEPSILFNNKKDAMSYVKNNSSVVPIAEPIITDQIEERIIQLVRDTILPFKSKLKKPHVGMFCVVVSDPEHRNFRNNIYSEYKSHRKKQPFYRPIFYKQVHKALALGRGWNNRHWSYGYNDWLEADDTIGIAATTCMQLGLKPLIVSVDKDLYQIQCDHYDLKSKKILTWPNKEQLRLEKTKYGYKLKGSGWIWFCAQLLMGDSVDNIRGIKGMGPKKSHDALIGLVGKPLKAYRTVRNLYKEKSTLEELKTNSRLVYILKKEIRLHRWVNINQS